MQLDMLLATSILVTFYLVTFYLVSKQRGVPAFRLTENAAAHRNTFDLVSETREHLDTRLLVVESTQEEIISGITALHQANRPVRFRLFNRPKRTHFRSLLP